jgi:predicted RNase H-like HicB family nuclease
VTERTYTVRVHDEGDDMLWAEVVELPGCFASGADLDELCDALAEAVGAYVSEPDRTVTARVERLGEGRGADEVEEGDLLVAS